MKESGHKTFDAYAEDYDVALARGISVSGEKKDYFAQRRIEWLRDCLNRFSAPVTALMDFGCGTGSSSPLFFDILGVENFVGRISRQNPWRSRGKHTARSAPSSFCLMNINPVANSIWCFAMVFFIIFRQWSAPLLSITSYDRCARVDFLRSGRTILGIRELVM